MEGLIKRAGFFEKYKSELMGICIIWIMLFHSSLQAPEPFLFRILWYLCISFGGGGGWR